MPEWSEKEIFKTILVCFFLERSEKIKFKSRLVYLLPEWSEKEINSRRYWFVSCLERSEREINSSTRLVYLLPEWSEKEINSRRYLVYFLP